MKKEKLLTLIIFNCFNELPDKVFEALVDKAEYLHYLEIRNDEWCEI